MTEKSKAQLDFIKDCLEKGKIVKELTKKSIKKVKSEEKKVEIEAEKEDRKKKD